MIRVIQRRLIIPRGDTGIFTIPAMTQAEGAIGVFTIFDPITNTRIFQKQVEIEGENFNISFSHADTVNLKAGEYLWDIKFYKNPILADNKVIDGEEINSYYAAFQAPKCEIRETGDDFLMIEGQPAKIEDLNIILGATEAANAAKAAATEQAGIATVKAEEAAVKLEEMKAAMPTKVSELENDSGYLQEETDPTVPAWAKAQTKPTYTAQEVGALPADTFIPSKVSDLTDDSGHYTKPVSGIPASDLEETYLTEHQDLSNYVQKTDYATSSNAGVVKLPSDAGLTMFAGQYLMVAPASLAKIKISQNSAAPITTGIQHASTFYGLAKAAGDTTQSESDNAVGTYTTEAKAAIRSMIGAAASADVTVQDVQVNGSSILNNGVANLPIASNSVLGLVKVNANAGINIYPTNAGNLSNCLGIVTATTTEIKSGQINTHPIAPAYQHESTFYGLAAAAGDTTQSQSDNAVGTYTAEAKAAIQTMLDVPSTSDVSVYATKADTVLETTLSRGRKANTTIGDSSFAFGEDVEASGYFSFAIGVATHATSAEAYAEGISTTASGVASHAEGVATVASGQASHAEGKWSVASGQYSHAEGGYNVNSYITTASGISAHAEGIGTTASGGGSHAEGSITIAKGSQSHTEGMGTIAAGKASHVAGKYNVEDSCILWPEWVANTSYTIGNKVKVTTTENNETVVTGYICKIANSDAEFTAANWTKDIYYNFVDIIGNGSFDARSNAYALDWSGNGHYMGNIYVGANADSTGGTKVLCEADFATAQDIQNIINGGAGA